MHIQYIYVKKKQENLKKGFQDSSSDVVIMKFWKFDVAFFALSLSVQMYGSVILDKNVVQLMPPAPPRALKLAAALILILCPHLPPESPEPPSQSSPFTLFMAFLFLFLFRLFHCEDHRCLLRGTASDAPNVILHLTAPVAGIFLADPPQLDLTLVALIVPTKLDP